MSEKVIYKCKLSSNNKFYVTIQHTIAFLDNCEIDEKFMNLFLILIREMCDDFEKRNITKIVQYVSKQEWYDYLKGKTFWKCTELPENQVMLICDIQNLYENLLKGFAVE